MITVRVKVAGVPGEMLRLDDPGETPMPETVAVTVTGPLKPLRLVSEIVVLV